MRMENPDIPTKPTRNRNKEMYAYVLYVYSTGPARMVPVGSFGEGQKATTHKKAKATMADEENFSYVCAPWAPILGFMGCASAIVFASEFRGGGKIV